MSRRFVLLLPAAAIALVLIASQQSAQAVRQALQLCAGSVIPSLFPFLVLSSLLMDCSTPTGGPLTALLGRCMGCSSVGARVFLLSLLGGYPVGPRLMGQLLRSGSLTHREAEHLLLFCNNAGPAFVLGFVGLGLLGSLRAGVWLYLLHIASALLTALLFRPRRPFPDAAPRQAFPPSFSQALVAAITAAGTAMLQVCAFITFFYTALQLLAHLTGIDHPLLLGFVELTCGLTQLPGSHAGFVMAAGLLGWGGLSVHAQTAAALSGTGVSLQSHLKGKLLQGIFSAILGFFAWFWVG